ncbi:pathogen-associated molecular patterns-induced protein A70-like [Arachis stenosperma]|uniref:pathogen-associated molecular patterns-induced protein A70-like n=1 Tax=Arachis stenosperma TaxID=217475 RepID=UPI0025ACC061|nr:pathogen-associated molecular patterns-induced protein A70-like [Arachis stenosperma]XP_057750354.1 pathogen-associated molecular patterns-induced protein A70-like [Arachis stenosperma]
MVFETASSFIASWLTPTCLFVFVNLVIGTIAIVSRFATHHQRQQVDSSGQLVRSTSLLNRVMSFNLYSYKDDGHNSVQENHELAQQSLGQSVLDQVNSSERIDDSVQHELARTPSLLERLKSIKFYKSESTKKVKEEEPEFGSGHQPSATKDGLDRVNSDEDRRIRNLLSRRWEGEELLGEEVDKKADDFINRFKQQLRLQRLDSILRYRELPKRN